MQSNNFSGIPYYRIERLQTREPKKTVLCSAAAAFDTVAWLSLLMPKFSSSPFSVLGIDNIETDNAVTSIFSR
jgi:hypothetical protein